MEGELHKTILLLLTSGLLAISSPAAPADKVLIMDPQNALRSDEFKAALGNDVAFYFIGAAKPAVKTQMEEILINKRTTLSLGPQEANCRRVLLAAFRDLKARVKKRGGDAVVNLVSFYREHYTADSTTVECHSSSDVRGHIILRGNIAQLDK